ncbi:uncharacterized protein CMU_019570 [Cryptosporidium muris RN66]|uniref:Uncharacterized protein n=1 Tax=Cryptosporidium muris (strain RN66) TaxID=441375 RepID=B6ACE4_CRYMR|nr:uncharacterized protein CMU_019570 [Cryptosporidium muris RN66]EEA06200.1 hypothetical protein CMU_019570 [Cryptosporidium muris RN66]|eukprot:XP_002140549.1 hypothetical protein [Cryptosporidium muris RN66]
MPCKEEELLSDILECQRILDKIYGYTSEFLYNNTIEDFLNNICRTNIANHNFQGSFFSDNKLNDEWLNLNVYLKSRNCGRCIKHAKLMFDIIMKLLNTLPFSVYLIFIPLSNDNIDTSPVVSICKVWRDVLYGISDGDYKIEKILDLLKYISLQYPEDDPIENKIENPSSNNENDNISSNSSSKLFHYSSKDAYILLEFGLDFFYYILYSLDNLNYIISINFLSTKLFQSCTRYILQIYIPVLKLILSTSFIYDIITSNKNIILYNVGIQLLRIKTLKLYQRLIPLCSYDKNYIPISRIFDDNCKDCIFDSMMDLLSPEFARLFISHSKSCSSYDIHLSILQIQKNCLLLLYNFCKYWNIKTTIDILFSIKTCNINHTNFPPFLNNFDNWSTKENSLNSGSSNCNIFSEAPEMFSNIIYRVISLSIYHATQIQQSNKSPESDSAHYNDYYNNQISLVKISIKIISFTMNSVLSLNSEEDANSELSIIVSRSISKLAPFILWLCEFVFEFKQQIPSIINILEEVNIIRVRLPFLTTIQENTFQKSQTEITTSEK